MPKSPKQLTLAGSRPANQPRSRSGASRSARHATTNLFSADGLEFRTSEERTVYLALRAYQDSYPEFEKFSISPLCPTRVPGHTWELDFLVTYKGRAGVIEVDGAVHNGKWSSDRSRDRLLQDAGVAYVDRIDVDDVNRPHELDTFIRRFLKRLEGS